MIQLASEVFLVIYCHFYYMTGFSLIFFFKFLSTKIFDCHITLLNYISINLEEFTLLRKFIKKSETQNFQYIVYFYIYQKPERNEM